MRYRNSKEYRKTTTELAFSEPEVAALFDELAFFACPFERFVPNQDQSDDRRRYANR